MLGPDQTIFQMVLLPCGIYLAREDVITTAGLTLNLVKRHLIGRCNG
jgi:hypothetical protein